MAALSEAFVDGLRLCLIVSAVLALLAAAVGAALLRRQQHTARPVTIKGTPAPAPHATTGAATPDVPAARSVSG